MLRLRTDWLLAFLSGIAAMAGLAYWFWHQSGQPPSQ